jgi:L-ascorbate metabolism protein UlaG (beta-lactamase superfamily)
MPKLTYFGHDAFQIENDGTKLLIDPFITGNELAPVKEGDLEADYILLTHGHPDHLGDAITIAKRCGATIVTVFELAMYCQNQGVEVHPMHIGGAFNFPWGRLKLTIAHHGSGIPGPDGVAYLGNPCGFIIQIGGKTIYHTGDTGLFIDMKLIGELDKIDVGLFPIGDNFTMGIDDAVIAVQFTEPKLSIPMHYDTFDVIKADPDEFVQKVGAINKRAQKMEYGQTIEI